MVQEMQRVTPSNTLACVFGVSGVGKSELIERFAHSHNEWKHLSASNLIAKLTNESREALRRAPRDEILENQRRAGELIRRERLAHPQAKYIVDAHSVIDNDRELVPVPVSAISFISPTALVFVYDEPSQILRRRAIDDSRERAVRSENQISEEQDLALASARQYSSALNVELRCVRSGDLDGLEAALHAR